ncbi:HugZ family protein [Reyranella sp.]|uniref:HugZ family pyridoxamine 5'-phosphate oxidase n=1 Tax=Reyranella sp. TaxID=1929291 RepID=UPI003C7A47DC
MPRTVRTLLRALDRASLATNLPGEPAGWPYASLVLVAVDHDLSPILLLSDMAEHTRAIKADGRVSLLFDGTVGLDQPLTGPRATVLGRAVRTADQRLKTRFLTRHPDAALYSGFKDFAFYRVAVERAHLVGGFGKIRWIDAAELAPPSAPGLAEAEASIVDHMNADHADALQLYAAKLIGRAGEGWKMTGIDPEGLDLRRGGEVARLAFDVPLQAVGEARKVLVDLVGKARARP